MPLFKKKKGADGSELMFGHSMRPIAYKRKATQDDNFIKVDTGPKREPKLKADRLQQTSRPPFESTTQNIRYLHSSLQTIFLQKNQTIADYPSIKYWDAKNHIALGESNNYCWNIYHHFPVMQKL